MDIVLRTILLYVFVLLLLRVTTRRILRSATALDLVVVFLLGGFAVPSLLAGDMSLTAAVLGMSTVVGMHFTLSRLRRRFPLIGMLTEGTSVRVYAPGGFDENQMLRSRITMQDVIAEMRQQGSLALDDVEAIIIEHNGAITILSKDQAKETGD